MTTYKYSESQYTPKYLGLSQAKSLIETFPWLTLTSQEHEWLQKTVATDDAEAVVEFVQAILILHYSDLAKPKHRY